MKDSEEKRLKSINEKRNSYKQQKNAVQLALSNVETKTNNKIIFDDDFEQNTFFVKPPKKSKVALFEDNDDEEDNNFEFKSKIDGKKGQKLLELQSKFSHDPRFTLDSNFVEDEQNEENGEVEAEDNLENEKNRQLDILSSITGAKIRKYGETIQKSRNEVKGMLRFDPAKSDHSKFQIEKPKPKEKKKTRIEPEEKIETNEAEVSKKTFYKVTDNLKQSLQENNSFSLLNMFGKAPETNGLTNNKVENNVAEDIKKRKHIGPTSNPFRYDSSDSEEEVPAPKQKLESVIPKFEMDRFFFVPNDSRFQEGIDFIKKWNDFRPSESYAQRRREIKQLVKSKLRNNKRNNPEFKQKLGGKKNYKQKTFKKRI